MDEIKLLTFKNISSLTYKQMEADLNKKWNYSCIQKYANNTLTIPNDFIDKMYEVYGVHIKKEYSNYDVLKQKYDALQYKYNLLLKDNESLRNFNIKICTEVVTDKAFKYILKEASYQGKFNEDIYKERRKYYEELMFGHVVSDQTVTPYDFQDDNVLFNLTCKKCKYYTDRLSCGEHSNYIQDCKCRQLACDLIEDNTNLEDELYYYTEDSLTKEIASGEFKTLKELKKNHPDIFNDDSKKDSIRREAYLQGNEVNILVEELNNNHLRITEDEEDSYVIESSYDDYIKQMTEDKEFTIGYEISRSVE